MTQLELLQATSNVLPILRSRFQGAPGDNVSIASARNCT